MTTNIKRAATAILAAASLSLGGCSTFVGGNLAPEGKPTGRIVLVNNTSAPINTVTISRCSAMSYGLDQMSGEIRSGGSTYWTVSAECWDVQAAYATCLGCSYTMAQFSDIIVRPGGGVRLIVNNGGAAGRDST